MLFVPCDLRDFRKETESPEAKNAIEEENESQPAGGARGYPEHRQSHRENSGQEMDWMGGSTLLLLPSFVWGFSFLSSAKTDATGRAAKTRRDSEGEDNDSGWTVFFYSPRITYKKGGVR